MAYIGFDKFPKAIILVAKSEGFEVNMLGDDVPRRDDLEPTLYMRNDLATELAMSVVTDGSGGMDALKGLHNRTLLIQSLSLLVVGALTIIRYDPATVSTQISLFCTGILFALTITGAASAHIASGYRKLRRDMRAFNAARELLKDRPKAVVK